MSIWHLIILLVVCVVIFGTGKLRNMGTDLGSAIRGFKRGLNEGDDEDPQRRTTEQLAADAPAAETVSQKTAEKVERN